MRNPDQLQRPTGTGKKPKKAVAKAVLFLVVGVGAAIGAALLLTRYMDARTAAARVPTVSIVVAKVDIPTATALKPEWLTAVAWPAASAPEGSATDPAQLAGRITLFPIAKNEAVLAAKLAQPGTGGALATLLEDGTRAVAVRVDDVVGVAGFIHPGDHVDVIVTMKPRDSDPETSKIILQNVKVLAVGKDVQAKSGREAEKTMPATVATLMVTPEQSEELALATTKGRLLLALRPILDDDIALTKGVVPARLYASASALVPAEGENSAKPKVIRVRAPAPSPQKKPEKRSVEILRGDLFEKRDFERGEGR